MTAVALVLAALLVPLDDTAAVRLTADHQVLQRDASGVAACVVELPAELFAGETVEYAVTRPGADPLRDTLRVAQDPERGRAGLLLKNLPAGGPYGIEVAARGMDGKETFRAAFQGVLVGDLWILAGQSNMQGAAPVPGPQTPHPLVAMLGMDNAWRPAAAPTHRIVESDAPVMKALLLGRGGYKSEGDILAARKASREGTPWGGAGCDVFFAEFLANETKVPVGLIPCAFGGTSLDEWSPALLDKGEASLYGNMAAQVKRAGGKVRGMLWYQGESDSAPGACDTYFDRFKTFVESVRRDTGNPDLPVFTVQIGRVVVLAPETALGWNKVREQQRRAAREFPGVHVTAANDLQMSDGIHIGWDGHRVLGERLGRMALPLVREGAAVRRGPDFEKAQFANEARTEIWVDCSNVAGDLNGGGNIMRGFAVSASADEPGRDVFFAVQTVPGVPGRLLLRTGAPLAPETLLSYGMGLNPAVNVVDADALPLLAFGPAPIEPFAPPAG
ncbi:MAG TPA: sialate O-acetylesterase [Candidatus Hydrogenedentes bacterium]|nr:sialate O-acetylesterase [Candidatus Hydrogenedentota bacterium]